MLGALAVLAALLSQTLRWYGGQRTAAAAAVVTGRAQTLVLDAGHGGEDGGAISLTGVPESRFNLEVVLKLDDVLGLYGVSPILLRREDIALYDAGSVTLREKKVSDLHNRAAAVQAEEGATLLSIHQNSFPEGRYRGTQTFYAPTDGSQQLAQHIQQAVRAALQPENSREAKQIPDTVYLMNHVDCRAVLVECGFLTNPEEEALLRDASYQRKLAVVLASAWLTAPGPEEAPDLG